MIVLQDGLEMGKSADRRWRVAGRAAPASEGNLPRVYNCALGSTIGFHLAPPCAIAIVL
jgi:hypothetical protein